MSVDNPSPEFLAAFRREAGATGILGFADFVRIALYDPDVGYYRRNRRRVGYGPGTDFFTASTSGAMFGELVVAACCNLLGGGDPGDYDFVEIGAESGATGLPVGVLPRKHPFRSSRAIGIRDAMTLTGWCIVFSNELFDAQPFERYVFREGIWRATGVAVSDAGTLREVVLERGRLPPWLPAGAEGQVFDAPTGAASLARAIAREEWAGLFVAFDYGLPYSVLASDRPQGTARGYFRHRQVNDLLARPGEQDLTCHVCWDWIADALVECGFNAPALEAQEAFFVRRAGDRIAALIEAGEAQNTFDKRALTQLLHPAHLGQKFQVMHAWRPSRVRVDTAP